LSSRSAATAAIVEAIWRQARNMDTRLLIRWIPTEANSVADRLSRLYDRNDYRLNPVLFQRLCSEFGTPEVDAFASRLNAQLPQFWSARPETGPTSSSGSTRRGR
jgi:hypothetical protein